MMAINNPNDLHDLNHETLHNDLLQKFQNNPQLLRHILLAKAEEDRRQIAEEWRQKEEAILESKLVKYEKNQKDASSSTAADQNRQQSHFDSDENMNALLENEFNGSPQFIDPVIPFFQPHTSPLQSEDYFFPIHQNGSVDSSPITNSIGHQDNMSISLNEFDLFPLHFSLPETSGCNFSVHSESSHNDSLINGSTHSELTHSNEWLDENSSEKTQLESSSIHSRSLSLPSSSKSLKSQNQNGNTAIIKSKSGRFISHRTLSYENVMNLEEYNIKMTNELSQKKKLLKSKRQRSFSYSTPLNHDKVMEALRAKLKRTSLPYSPCRKPFPERSPSPPPPPPPSTFPTTSVLMLNLNTRRRKQSTLKNSNN